MAIFQAAQDTRSGVRVVIHTACLVVLIILSLTGNAFVCFAMYRNRRLRTIPNLYVLALALADITIAVFVFPFSAIASAARKWPFHYNFCQFHGFVSYYWGAVSIFILALTAINRYFCIVRPNDYQTLFTKKRTVTSLVMVWVVALLLGILVTYEAPVEFQWHPDNLYCREVLPHNVSQMIVFLLLVGCFIALPVLCIVFGYGSVFFALRQHNTAVAPSLQSGSNSEKRRAEEVRTCRILFAAVIGVCASWMPTIAILILEYGFYTPLPSTVALLRVLFASFSSWINPLIYGVMNRAMRKEFLKILLCCKEN